MFVLSPSVAATKTSARSTPARAARRSPAPSDGEQAATVLPGALLAHVQALVRQRVLIEDRHLMNRRQGQPSRRRIRRARHPRRGGTSGGEASASHGVIEPSDAPRSVRGGRRGQDHAARRLLNDVLRDISNEVVQGRPAAQKCAPADPRRLLGREHDGLDAAPAGLLDDGLPAAGARAPWRWRPRRPRTPPPPPWRAAAPPGRARAGRRAAGRRSAAPSAPRRPTAPRSWRRGRPPRRSPPRRRAARRSG